MKRKIFTNFTKMLLVAALLVFVGVRGWGQTNPVAQTLPYSQNFASLTGVAPVYPAGFQGWDIAGSLTTTFPTAAPSADRAITVVTNVITARHVGDFIGKMGLMSTGAAMSTICLSINTTGNTNIQVSFDAMTQRTENSRQDELELQYRIGTSGTFTDIASSTYQNQMSPTNTAGTVSVNIINKVVTLPVATENQAVVQLRWVIRDISGAGNRPGFAIDNISITGTNGASTPPTLTADATFNDVDHNMDITFTDDVAWRTVITAVKIGGTTLTPTTDYTITAGNLQLIPSGGNPLLTASGSKSVTVEATGYSAASVTQQINAGAPTGNSTAGISSALAPSTSRTITCTAKDQYNNLVSGYTFKYDLTITDNNATTTESYTIDGTARTTTTNDISVVVTTNGSGVATFTAALPATIDVNDGLSIQAQLNNGTSNIGSAFSYTQLSPEITLAGTSPGSSSVAQSSTDNVLYRIQVDIDVNPSILNSVHLTTSGTYSAADIASNGFKLWYSVDGSFGGDVNIGSLSSASGSGEALSFTGLTQAFPTGTAFLFITADISATATIGHTVSCSASSDGDFTFAYSPVYSGSSYQAANLHTIVAAPAGPIAAWQLFGKAGNEATVDANTLNSNLNISTLYRGSGLNASALANVYSSTNFTASGTKADAITSNKFLTFSINTKPGFQVSLSSLDVRFRRSGTGPNAFRWQYTTDGTNYYDLGSADISYTATTTGGDAQTQIDLSGVTALQNVPNSTTITIRLLCWGASATGGTFAIGRSLTNGATDYSLAIGGSICTTGQWTGDVDNDWSNGGNWCGGSVPISSTDVIIPVGVTQPTIISSGALCHNLTIDNGAVLTIASAGTLTASGTTTLSGTECLIISSEGSFIDNGISGAGTARVEKNLTDSRWWYIGAPINNATAAAFTSLAGAPTTDGNRLFYWDETSHAYVNVTNTADAMPVLTGFSFKRFSTSSPDAITVAFTGSLNTAPVTPIGGTSDLTYTAGTSQGFNLVCNPFPSAINWGCINTPTTGLTQTNLETTIWYRSNGGFATYNSSGAGTGQNAGERIIPAMQAFWVRTNGSAGGMEVTNAARVHDSQTFYKTASETNIFRISVSDGTNNDEAVVGFYQDAQDVFENFDSEKMMADENIPQLYTITSDNAEVAINGLPELTSNNESIVPLGFSTNIAGTFTLKASNLAEFNPSFSVYLEDVQQNVLQDLQQNPSYSFTSGVGNSVNRFKLHFGNFIASISTDIKNNVYLYAVENNIFINTSEESTVEVYSSIGEKISSEYLIKGLNKIPVNAAKGIYIVKVQTSAGVVTKKVFIGK